MDTPEKRATWGTQDEEKQNKNKHKYRYLNDSLNVGFLQVFNHRDTLRDGMGG